MVAEAPSAAAAPVSRRGSRLGRLGAPFLLLALVVATQWELIAGGTVVGLDTATQYWPWYAHLGERLRAGDVPGWNPYSFSGVPFAADPLSGWAYLPAMLLFSALPIALAANAFILLHPMLAGLAVHTLARVLGMSRSGALLAAIIYACNGYIHVRGDCCAPHLGILAWLPVGMLGVELAVRQRTWLHRTLCWGLAGLALSQALAVWLGQGSYYALLATGAYVGYRTLLSPPEGSRGVRSRLAAFPIHATGVFGSALALAAAGLLPRIEYNLLSNLAGGYVAPRVARGGWVGVGGGLVSSGSLTYAGAAALAVAALALPVARGRYAAPYWVGLSLAALALSGRGATVLHTLFLAIPGANRLHPHEPGRILLVFYLGVALAAGAAVSALPRRRRGAVLLALVPAAGLLALARSGLPVAPIALLALAASAVLLAARALLSARREAATALLIAVVFAELFAGGRAAIARQRVARHKFSVQTVALGTYYDGTGALRWLQMRDAEQPFRYIGYAHSARNRRLPYTFRYADPAFRSLGLNNRSVSLGIEDVQGYNAVHLRRYDELVAAMNGRRQDYHDAEVFERGLGSPLLDLLGARYIVAPAVARPGQADLEGLYRTYPTVYRDATVRVLENREALPRSWLVHAALRSPPGAALELLRSGAVDPRRTVLLEETPPPLAAPAVPGAERATVREYAPDRILLDVSATAPAMLVLSEVHYPAWRAFVDGREAHVYVANHALRAVAIPPGEHRVEMRFASWTLAVGIALSTLAHLALAALALAARGRGESREMA